MSTPTKKRRLPEWVTSGLSPASKEESKFTTDSREVKAKEAKASCSSDCSKIQKTRSFPSVTEETKTVGGASSSKTKEAKVSNTMGGFEDKNIKAKPPIKVELDSITDTTGPKRETIDVRFTGVKEEAFKIRGTITELQAKVKEEPEERAEGVSVINERLDRRNIFSINEESKDMNERKQLLSESIGKKSQNSFQNRNSNSVDDVGGKCTTASHHVKANNSRFEHYRNENLQQICQNEFQSKRRNDVEVKIEETDTGVFVSTQKAGEENCKPLVRQFSKLLEGVIFSISGLVNPERTELRKMALDMGADYRPSWCSDCTLLIAAFHNTPAFNQVKAVDGTIVHKDWIVECCKRKELIAIEEYMMHVGNPWRASQDMDESPLIGVVTEKASPSQKDQVKAHKTGTVSGDHKKLTSTAEDGTKISRCNAPDAVINKVTRAEIQHWFVEDLKAMRSWLEERHEKPEQEMLEFTAAQGLVACLEDAIQSLEENQGLKLVLDAWAFIPKAVKQLEKELTQVSRMERVVREAERIKSIYTAEMQKMGLGDPPREEMDDDATEIISDTESRDSEGYNSDDTEDLHEDEITQCQNQILRRFAFD